ncbi:MAG: hypothetical protein JWM44_3105 [Bacilli bacterium]|nr:hypothetical protein [Bacilli bacterium]
MQLNIEEIKERMKKNELLLSCDLIDLSADVEYLLYIIEQLNEGIDEALKHSKGAPYDSIFENKDRLLEVRSILQAIRK